MSTELRDFLGTFGSSAPPDRIAALAGAFECVELEALARFLDSHGHAVAAEDWRAAHQWENCGRSAEHPATLADEPAAGIGDTANGTTSREHDGASGHRNSVR